MLISQQSEAGPQQSKPRAVDTAGVNREVARYIESLIDELSTTDGVWRDVLMTYLFAILDDATLSEGRHRARPAWSATMALKPSPEPAGMSYEDLPRALIVGQFTRGVDLLSAIRIEVDELVRCNSEDLGRIEALGERIDRLNADDARLIDLIRAG